jgi:hypothetical protein
MTDITKPQMEALKLFPNGPLLTQGRYGNLCAELAKKGYARFDGYERGKRKFSITDKGVAALTAGERDGR